MPGFARVTAFENSDIEVGINHWCSCFLVLVLTRAISVEISQSLDKYKQYETAVTILKCHSLLGLIRLRKQTNHLLDGVKFITFTLVNFNSQAVFHYNEAVKLCNVIQTLLCHTLYGFWICFIEVHEHQTWQDLYQVPINRSLFRVALSLLQSRVCIIDVLKEEKQIGNLTDMAC